MNKKQEDIIPFEETQPMEEIPFEATEPIVEESQYSAPAASARGFVQGATLGYGDEAEAIARTIANYLRNKNKEKTIPETYRKERDIIRKENELARAQHPIATTAGELAGGASTMLIPGLGEANLAKMAGIGAIAGIGAGQADLTKGEIGKAGFEAGTGAALGTALGAASPYIEKGVTKLAGKAADILGDTAIAAARRALGYRSSDLNKKGLARANEVAKEILDQEKIKLSPEKTLEGIKELNEQTGEKIGSFRNILGEKGEKAYNAEDVAKQIKDTLGTTRSGGVYDKQKKDLQEVLDTILAHKEENGISYPSAVELKKTLASNANFDLTGDVQKQRMYSKAYGIAEEALDKATELSNKRLSGDQKAYIDYLKNKDIYGKTKEAISVATRGLNKEAVAPNIGLKEIAVSAAFPTDIATKKLGAIGAYKIANKFGAAATAKTAKRLSEIARDTPQDFGAYASIVKNAVSRSPQTFAVTHFLLSHNDPKYQETIENIEEKQ